MNALSTFDDERAKEIINEYAMIKHFVPLDESIDVYRLNPNIAENFRDQFRTVIWNDKLMDIDKVPVVRNTRISQPATTLALPYYADDMGVPVTDALKVEMFTKDRTWKQIADAYGFSIEYVH